MDIFAECVISSKKFWLRYLCGSNRDSEESGPGSEFKPCNRVMMTNLKPLRSLCNTPLVVATSQSTVKLLSSSGKRVETREEEDFQLRSFFAPTHSATAKGSEVKSFCMVIADWTVTPLDNANNAVNNTNALNPVTVEVLGYTEQRMCVMLQLVVVSADLVSKISWLSKFGVVKVAYAILIRVDTQYDIQLYGRFDRTSITALDPKSWRVLPEMRSLLESKYQVDAEICEEMRRRLQALKNNNIYYESMSVSGEVEMCTRQHLYDALVTIHFSHKNESELENESSSAFQVMVTVTMPPLYEEVEMFVSSNLLPLAIKDRCRRRYDIVFVDCFPAQDYYYRNSRPIRRIKWIGLSGSML